MSNIRFLSNYTERLLEHWQLIFKFLVVSAVIASGTLLVPRMVMGNRFPILLFLGYLSLIVVVIFLRWPVLGLIAIVLGGMLVPFVGPSGTNVVVAGTALMLGLWLLKMMMEQRQIRLVASRATLPLFAFLIISFIAFLVGQLTWYVYARHTPLEAQLGGFAIFLLSAGAFLLVAHLVTDLSWLQALTWIFIAFGAIYMTGRLVRWGGIDRIFSLGFSSGSMFWTWLVALTFSQAIFNRSLHLRWRIVLGCILLVTFYVAYFQAYDWKSGWLPPLVAIAAILAFRYWRSSFLLMPFGVIPFYYLAIKLIGTDKYSWGTRVDAWIIVLNIVKANPILGLGFANYFWITKLFPIRGYEVAFNSHNQYIDILAQTGIIGLLVFLWFFWEVGRVGWSLRERVPEGFPRAYVYGALGGLVGTLVAATMVDWVLPFVYNIGFNGFRASILAWIFLGGLVSLEQIFPVQPKNA
jgi:O-antigen ligase